jgi:putative phosphoesterase
MEDELMRLGLMADTHDRLPAVAEFARRFTEGGIGLVLHAGDFCAPFALGPIHAANLALAGVFGRSDGDRKGLRAEASRGVGTELYESPHSVEVNGQRILLVHDIDEVGQRSLGAHTVVVHGCSHRQEVRSEESTLIVNPGEACGWLYGRPSAAILDLTTRHVELLTLEGAEWRT